MKSVLLFLLLCGVACSLATPICTEEEYLKCDEGQSKEYELIETAAQLDKFCRNFSGPVDCQIDMTEKCPNADFARLGDYLKEKKKFVGLLCDKTNPFRKKFLDNVKCLNQNSTKVIQLCIGDQMPEEDDKGACNKLKGIHECLEEELSEMCGEDAKEVAVEHMKIQMHRFNCM